jgi:hypothetical protein
VSTAILRVPRAPFRLSRKYGGAHHAQSQTRVSPAQLAHYLKGIEFPASKRELKADAKNNKAPPEILKFIDELPEEQYRTMAEVMKAVGEIE